MNMHVVLMKEIKILGEQIRIDIENMPRKILDMT